METTTPLCQQPIVSAYSFGPPGRGKRDVYLVRRVGDWPIAAAHLDPSNPAEHWKVLLRLAPALRQAAREALLNLGQALVEGRAIPWEAVDA